VSLYAPRAFASRDLALLDELADRHDFASLVTVVGGQPFASHIPLTYRREGERIEVTGHLARANPQSSFEGAALLMVHGPHAYISPTWYPDKADQARVPTWNYAVAHLSGRLERFDDEASLAALVGALSDRHEARAGGDWRFDFDAPAERAQLRGIVGFRLHVERIEFKLKLGQNHPLANRHAVIARLAAGDDDARAVARLMQTTLED
jgi:transcriptional regulator